MAQFFLLKMIQHSTLLKATCSYITFNALLRRPFLSKICACERALELLRVLTVLEIQLFFFPKDNFLTDVLILLIPRFGDETCKV